MNFIEKINSLLKEALTFKQYKRMNVALRIFAGILMFPSYVVCFALTVVYYIFAIFHKLVSLPAEILEKFYKNQSRDVHYITEAVIYLICLPFVFLLRIELAFLSFFLGVYYFILNIALQIASLNGITFKPFIIEDVERDYSPLPKMPVLNGLTFVLVCYLFLIASAITIFAAPIAAVIIVNLYTLLYVVFVIVYPICVFKKDGSNRSVNKAFAIVCLAFLGVHIISCSGVIVGKSIHNAVVSGQIISGQVNKIEFTINKTSSSTYTKSFYVNKSGYYQISFSKRVTGYVNNSYTSSDVYTMTAYLESGTNELSIKYINGDQYGTVDVDIIYID